MGIKNYLNSLAQLCFFLAISSTALSYECGEPPATPDQVEGATATRDELVATSQAVQTYIADADVYLDCTIAYMKTDEYRALKKDEKDAVKQLSAIILNTRNAIGDEFNAEVEAYKEANAS